MAKVTITIPDDDLTAVDHAADREGISRSEFMAREATRAAMRSAREEYNRLLAGAPTLAADIATARSRALRRGRAHRAGGTAARLREAA